MARDVQTMMTVRSGDGTTIAFERAGDGPSVILVDGALRSGVRDFPAFVELARLLEPLLTVYRFDRRGRGGSGELRPMGSDHQQDASELFAGASRARGGGNGNAKREERKWEGSS